VTMGRALARARSTSTSRRQSSLAVGPACVLPRKETHRKVTHDTGETCTVPPALWTHSGIQKRKTLVEEERVEAASPQQALQSRIEAGVLAFDPDQVEVTRHFQALYEEVATWSPPPLVQPTLMASIFSSLGWSSEEQSPVPRGVYLWGTVGGGKTMLMDLFHSSVEALGGTSCRRVHYPDFMQDVHRRMHEAKKAAPPRDMARMHSAQPFNPVPPVGDSIMQESSIICLDEFQVTDIADAMILKVLFSYLWDRGVVLVATSNRPPRDLYKNGIQRSNFLPFLDMLEERCTVVSLDPGVDYRRRNLGDQDRLFFNSTRVEEDAEGNMKCLFKFMAAQETDNVGPKTIRIKGRDVSFNSACGGLLDSDFTELCGRPLWTNDYLKITQVFHTVFIRDIPKMSQNNKALARRFICLIDCLYDHKVRVVASGQDDYPNLFQDKKISEEQSLEDAGDEGRVESGLFSGEEELFAFDRTVSRLAEMQTKDYWMKWRSHMGNRS